MTTYVTPLGALPEGVIYKNATGAFSAVSAPTTGQVLTSTGVSSFAFMPMQNLPSPAFSTGILQMALTTVGGAIPYPIFPTFVVGNNLSVYDPAAVVLSGTFMPYSTTSMIQIEWSMTPSNSQTISYANIYFYPAFNTAPFGSSTDSAAQAGDIGARASGTLIFPAVNFLDTIPFAVCVFKSAGGSAGGINQSDFVLITEYATQTPLPPTTVTAVLIDATPVSLFTVDASGSPLSASRYVSGTVLYSDVANLISNTQTFQFLMQYDVSSNTTTCTVGPSNSLAAAPFLTYTIVGNTVSVNAIGLVGETFNVNCTYTFIQGSI